VSFGSSFNILLASVVGRIKSLTLLRFAHQALSCITGNLP
jgi:hypothetical protein